MVQVSFIGDISLNSVYNEFYEKGVDPFHEVSQLLHHSDLVVGNLECLAKGDFGENERKRPRLNTKPETLNYLANINLGLALLANNHIYDNLEDGFLKTIRSLEKNNIKYIGASSGKDTLKGHYIHIQENISICFLNYVTSDTNYSLDDYTQIKVNGFSLERAIIDIEKYKKQCDFVVMCIHWGGFLEGAMYPDKKLPQIAHQLIDKGCDLIVGHHSHTLQPYEIYRSKYIFYSLGNFCFGDVEFEGKRTVWDKKRNASSVILHIKFFKSHYEIQPDSILNRNGFILLSNDKTRIKRMNARVNLIYSKLLWPLYVFKEKKIYPGIRYFFRSGHNPFTQFLLLDIKKIKKHLLNIFTS